ncbi:tRNA dihydrouridine synthase [Desulfurivibrio alkaliphilus]|uniref:tRNA-dihydrouridine synthase n=1 Tax=Desulfurivibrio alkaliphilus (strain DSM 19089 / UNIQEM U267 / AHT2) TaxID=589865 RepID=D6Z5C2_DESAT|nr:tRNA-dihydrouridine synthase family protein [Desulfurivibrio alkaliphilus]ADH84779.1 dihydrouridine synthase DuS [Desulfurivibrio alkaliphilus AHT 2]
MKENNGRVLEYGGLRISPPLLLAPMAGLTHSALRRLVQEQGGVGLLSTEMLAAKRLPHENPTLSPYLVRHPSEQPLSFQLLLTSPAEVAAAVASAEELGAAAIDLNLGCPAPDIRRQGGGSRLMEEPQMVRRLVQETRRRTALPLSAKIRLGEELNAERLRAFCLLLEDAGVDLLTVHARLRGEPYGRKPRWEWVGKVKHWLRIPVVANGGIFSAADAAACLAASGADGLMIGRAAAATPWLFRQLAEGWATDFAPGHDELSTAPSQEQKAAIYRRFCELLKESFTPERRLGRLKEFTHYYARNYQFGHHLAAAVQSSPDLDTARRRAEHFLATA